MKNCKRLQKPLLSHSSSASMATSSTPSKRVALAPVNINISSPLHRGKSSSGLSGLPPNFASRNGLSKSASMILPSRTRLAPARKLESFSEYKISNNKNVKADLAATKLKLRLQLAFYKLKLKKDALMAASPTIRVCKSKAPAPRTFHTSANRNLKKVEPATRLPLLNTIASRKPSGSLRLFHIKPLSSFHNAYPQLLPLSTQRLPSVHKILKTPMKATSRMVLQNNANSNSDETIDETVDEVSTDLRKGKEDILGSSPLRHSSFGTPSSFSVAKSLLQLGLGYY